MTYKHVVEEQIPAYVSHQAREVKLHICNSMTYFGMMTGTADEMLVQSQNRNSEFSIEVKYINNTGREITAMTRNGLSVVLPVDANIQKPNVIIRNIIKIRGTAKESLLKYLAAVPNIKTDELELVKEQLGKVYGRNEAMLMLDYITPITEIMTAPNETVYHYQTDTLLSLKPFDKITKHPYYGEEGNFTYVGEVVPLDGIDVPVGYNNNYNLSRIKSLHMRIRYADCTPTASVLYINMYGTVMALYPERGFSFDYKKHKDSSDTPGKYIEITYTAKNDGISSHSDGVIVRRMSLEEAKKKIGVYNTPIEAIEMGSIENRQKAHLADREAELTNLKLKVTEEKTRSEADLLSKQIELGTQELELQRLKNDNALFKADLDNKNLVLEEEQRQFKLAQARFEMDLKQLENTRSVLEMQRKDNDAKLTRDMALFKQEIEQRQAKRKDSVDMLKTVPAVIIAVGAIATIWYKNSK